MMNRFLIAAALGALPVLAAPAEPSAEEQIATARIVAVSAVMETLGDDDIDKHPQLAAKDINRLTAAIRRGRAYCEAHGADPDKMEAAFAAQDADPDIQVLMRDFEKALEIVRRNGYYGSKELEDALNAFCAVK